MSRLLDKQVDGKFPFTYRNSSNTDVTKTWAEARKRMEEEKAKREQIIRQLPKRCQK